MVQLEDTRSKLKRARELAAMQLIPAMELETAEVNVRQAEAALNAADAQIVQARASLNQSQVNLAHTIITAPIDGIVISRNVDVGQTVAASMQAPTLFVIARDLSAMQVNASVAESDIGRIQAGQSVSFRVDAYPDHIFAGTVSQVRLEPVVEQNVVSYITVIDVSNPGLKLKPGMTANVTVEIDRSDDVLRVPNAALRLRPSVEVLTALGVPPLDASTGSPNGERHGPAVWTPVDGRLVRISVRVGLTDGAYTAVFSEGLSEGTEVVTGITADAVDIPTASASPLLPSRGRGAGGGGAGATRPPRP
jgi:HlyD family secretion protein